MRERLFIVLLVLLVCSYGCQKTSASDVEKLVLESVKDKTYHVYASGYYNNDAGWVKFTKCKLVHKSDNLYVGQLCTANGLCKQIEVVCDGENMTWSEK